MGFRGAVRSEAAAASEPRASASGEVNPNPTRAGAADPAEGVLPPGLYEPSNDHLSHALSSDARFHPIPAGSETDFVRPRSGAFQPGFLEPHEFETVRRIVKLIIGEPSGPSRAARGPCGVGAASVSGREGKDASSGQAAEREQSTDPAGEAAEWIDLRLSQAIAIREASRRQAPDHRALAVAYYGSSSAEDSGSADPPKACREGLHWLEEESQQRHRKSFLGLDDHHQLELLWDISDARSDRSPPSPGTRFFQWIKGEVTRGYYTSQAGLKELDYRGNSFYPEPPGCEDHDHLR
jgi:gluconate 2-dehydrogenase subunit 3-like protein